MVGKSHALLWIFVEFDAVLCVFGIFFVTDLQGAIRELWRLVRPNGLLAITIWGRGLFEPADGIFWEAVRREDPELYRSIKPWSKIFEPDPLRAPARVRCV